MGKTKTLEIHGSSNIGIYAYANDKFCLIGKGFTEEQKETFQKALDVPIHEITIARSSQVGAYITGNSRIILVPAIITEAEKAQLDKLGIKYAVIETKLTALGNNVFANDHYMFHNTHFEAKAIQDMKDALGVEGDPLELKGYEVVGSVVAMNAKGGLIQNDVPEDIRVYIEEKMQIPFERGTLNFGSRVIGGCVVVNSYGMVVGRASAGIEITNADLAFGFLEK
jgi:translation initiation factor 6